MSNPDFCEIHPEKNPADPPYFWRWGGLREFFNGDPYVTHRVPKCVSDD